MPSFMTEIIAEVTARARASKRNQPAFRRQRGRVHFQLRDAISNALRRSIRQGEAIAAPASATCRISSPRWGVRLRWRPSARPRRPPGGGLTKRATLAIFGRYCNADDLDDIVTAFDLGNAVETGSDVPSATYASALSNIEGLSSIVAILSGDAQRPRCRRRRWSSCWKGCT